MYNDEFKEYHYNRGETVKDDYQPAPAENAAPTENTTPVEEPRTTCTAPTGDPKPAYTEPKAEPVDRGPAPKQGYGMKAVALVLVCAIVSGLCGFGGAALYGTARGTSKVTVVEQQISQSDDTAAAPDATVTVKTTDGQVQSFADVYEANVDSVVFIKATKSSYNYFGQTTQSASAGSGFVITEDGYIVTNEHIVSGATSAQVTLHDGTVYDAEIIGADADYDVAVLKIDASGLKAVTLGSSAALRVGDSVAAIGNPLVSLTFSMSQGIVSACNRTITLDGMPFNLIQMDTSINPGNSGGPLMNQYGQVVGIVNAKYLQYAGTDVEGVSFAIPIDDVMSVITEIMASGSVNDKAYMAITCGTMTSQMAQQYNMDIDKGVFVYSVDEGGAGAKAGLQMGDVITKMGDTVLTSRNDMTAAMKYFRAGDTVTLTVYRDGSYITTDITFDARPQTTGTTGQDSSQGTQNPYGQNPYGQYPGNGQDYTMEDLFRYFFGNQG